MVGESLTEDEAAMGYAKDDYDHYVRQNLGRISIRKFLISSTTRILTVIESDITKILYNPNYTLKGLGKRLATDIGVIAIGSAVGVGLGARYNTPGAQLPNWYDNQYFVYSAFLGFLAALERVSGAQPLSLLSVMGPMAFPVNPRN